MNVSGAYTVSHTAGEEFSLVSSCKLMSLSHTSNVNYLRERFDLTFRKESRTIGIQKRLMDAHFYNTIGFIYITKESVLWSYSNGVITVCSQ